MRTATGTFFLLWVCALAAASSLPAGSNTIVSHWAFQAVRDPRVPAVANKRWPNNDVDRFILERLEAAGLPPNLAADKRVLIRRASFDLTGLPPTPAEIDRFLADRSPKAYERLLDRLLASPRYGERWGRHWLDLVRYADTAGDSSDYPIPQAYKYRNYVIDAFNKDKPYDEFLREQIAGDLLPATTLDEWREHVIATGFIASARRFSVEPSRAMHLTIEDTLDTMSRAVLGLSMSCARCHDHKFDPITMQDYYGLYGIFSSTQFPYPGSEEKKRQSDFVPLLPRDEVEALAGPFLKKQAALQAEIERLDRAISKARRTGEGLAERQAELKNTRRELEQLWSNPPAIETAYAVTDAQPGNARVQMRGEPHQPGEEVPRRFPKVLGGQELPKECSGSGRLELAGWLTDPANPLTARVMVNRLWQHHFGKGLVATPSDFGTRGRPPTHPALLDHLAVRFVESGWSIKAIHKLIMLSATYQQSSLVDALNRSTVEAEGAAPGCSSLSDASTLQRFNGSTVSSADSLDADNALLWKFPRQRLDAEQVRDALLYVGGMLDLAIGGAHPFPPEYQWEFTQHNQFNAVYESNKRSVYVMQQRIKRQPFFAMFDGADPNASTAERPVTTTPLQALFMMNDAFAHAQAEQFASRLLREAATDSNRIDLAYQLALGRRARPDEIHDGLAYLQQVAEKLGKQNPPDYELRQSTWASYARALLASNEFMFVD
jgi:hypothetical protein